jgi:hypothetical protein
MVNIIAPPMKDKRVIVIPTSVSASMIILNTAPAKAVIAITIMVSIDSVDTAHSHIF